MSALFSLQGRRALITGSTRGIGLAIASAFAQAGARVCLNGPADDDDLEAAVRGAGAAGGIAADLSEPQAVGHLAEAASALLGGVDILVLNASIEVREDWDKISDEAFHRQVSVNLDASRRLIALLTPGMAERRWGRVLAIGSVQEIKEHPKLLIYAALKAAQTSMMRNLARQLGPFGVTCNTLAPGAIETERNRAVLADDDYRAAVLSRIPVGFIGAPEHCAGAALLLCSDAGRYITGERLLVDGGMHL
jgi:NAD(P)-dependent dehydrogenase (short-subunit alcohol dehydrogenase family)